ncbi:MAG: NAD(P)-dependent oxidoreductase [Bryobacteraceae bacterium]|jgi:3-hydroxyisobutyrate dehydrogenase-like beta-hydroxyacid dehydrogenase
MELGFIGLGNMGSAMARNLLRAGHQVTVYNRTADKARLLEKDGAVVAANIAQACKSGVVATMLADDPAVEQTVFGEAGILASLSPGGIHVGMSTISLALARRLTEAHQKAGQTYISAPVFGRPQAAEAAKLAVVAAGPEDAVLRCKPAFEAMGQRTVRAGDQPFQANVIKLCGNFMIMSMIEATGEALALCRKAGANPELFLEVMSGLFQSPVMSNYGKIVVEQNYDPAGFKLTLGLKDAKLVLAAGDECAVPMRLASLVRDHFLSGIARGYGDLDWAAIAKVVAEDAGISAAREVSKAV